MYYLQNTSEIVENFSKNYLTIQMISLKNPGRVLLSPYLVLPIGVVVIGVAIVAVFVPGNIRVAEGKSGGVAGSQASSKDHDAPNRNQLQKCI